MATSTDEMHRVFNQDDVSFRWNQRTQQGHLGVWDYVVVVIYFIVIIVAGIYVSIFYIYIALAIATSYLLSVHVPISKQKMPHDIGCLSSAIDCLVLLDDDLLCCS